MRSANKDVGELFDAISPDATAHFDAEGLQLLASIRPRKPPSRRRAEKSVWQPDIQTTASLSEDDIVGGMFIQAVDPFTMEISDLSWDDTGLELVLSGDDYLRLVRLSSKVASLKPLSGCCLASTVRQTIVGWLSAARCGTTNLLLWPWLATELGSLLADRTLCVPIAWLHVQNVVTFGGHELIPLTSSVRRDWINRVKQAAVHDGPDWQPTGQLSFAFRMAWTGLLVQTFGESDACTLTAYKKAEEVCGLLRFFWPGNGLLGSRCFVLTLGAEAQPQQFVVELDDGCPTIFSESLTGPQPEPLVLSTEFLDGISKPFSAMSRLIQLARPSDFQRKLLASLLLYTRNNLHVEVVDRLIAVLVALEAMLLRGSSEPIQSALGQRLAVLTMATLEERIELIGAVRRCYDIRSSFLHHGLRKTEDRAVVESVLKAAWFFFMECLLNHEHLDSIAAFHSKIDASLLGGDRVNLWA